MSVVNDRNGRLSAVRQRLAEWEVDGLLISSEFNRRWLSGFTGSAGFALITADQALLATDFRYWAQATQQAPAFTLVKLPADQQEGFKQLVAAAGVHRIGIEAQHVNLSQLASWRKIKGIKWVALAKTVEPLREIKAAWELGLIKAAAAVTDQAMSRVYDLARPDLTEKVLAWELEKALREGGADDKAFTVIVASGTNAGLPHHRPGDRTLQAGDSLVIDMGAMVDGYRSDLTRSFYLGREPDEHYGRIYNLVWTAQKTALAGMRGGMTGKEIDALSRNVINDAGFGDYFGHSLGHGVGLEVHEEPRLATTREKERISAGTVVTVEPGIYLPEWGGVRLEDLVLVTENGPELLSHAPKRPEISWFR